MDEKNGAVQASDDDVRVAVEKLERMVALENDLRVAFDQEPQEPPSLETGVSACPPG